MTTLVHPTTAAVTSIAIRIRQTELTISADNLAGAESVAVEYRANSSAQWKPAQNSDGAIVLVSTKAQVVVRGSGDYRVVKPVTAGSCGVFTAQ